MRFLVRSFLWSISAALLISAAEMPVVQRVPPARPTAPAVAHSAPQPRSVARPAVAPGSRAYPVPPTVALQHPELRPHAAGFTGIRPGAYSNHDRYFYDQHRRPGYLPYVYYSVPYVYPLFDSGDYDASYQQNNAGADALAAQAQTDAVTQSLLSDQIQHLSAEVDSLKNQSSQSAPAQTSDAPSLAQQSASEQAPSQPPITVVLKNGNEVQVQNYAVMGQTFWDLTTQPARKIPISTINIPASINASNANGADFPSLGSTH